MFGVRWQIIEPRYYEVVVRPRQRLSNFERIFVVSSLFYFKKLSISKTISSLSPNFFPASVILRPEDGKKSLDVTSREWDVCKSNSNHHLVRFCLYFLWFESVETCLRCLNYELVVDRLDLYTKYVILVTPDGTNFVINLQNSPIFLSLK